MLHNTRGIVLRSVKYGETSLIVTIFTELYGVQSYIVQGIRSAKAKQQRAGLLQPATLLDLVVYHKPQNNLQRIKEFQPAYIYHSLHEEIVKNSIALFSAEVLLRLLPEHASMPEAFDFTFNYLSELDKLPLNDVANFPLYFTIGLSRIMGYDIHGSYTQETPNLNLKEGAYTHSPPAAGPYVNDEDAAALSKLLPVTEVDKLKSIELNAATRSRLLDWYLEFMHMHTQHMGTIKSLAVLQAVLH
jgi:DNA repair protein RecO (recombination protein O)